MAVEEIGFRWQQQCRVGATRVAVGVDADRAGQPAGIFLAVPQAVVVGVLVLRIGLDGELYAVVNAVVVGVDDIRVTDGGVGDDDVRAAV